MIGSLISKVNRDQHFGQNQEFRQFLDNQNDNSLRSDSGVSSTSTPSMSDQTDRTIVDLDLIVEKWIYYMWEKTKTSKQSSKYEFDDLNIVVNWSKVELVQDEAKFSKENRLESKMPTSQTLFRTFFTNNTDIEQEYSFKTDRVTRQSCGFQFMKGFMREKEGGVSFKLPDDILEIGGGLRSEQSIECGKDQTNEQEISWGVDSVIKVKPHHRTKASLIINELKMEREFSLETRMKGRLTVQLSSRNGQNEFIKSFSGDIVEIITRSIEKLWLPPNASVFEIVDDGPGKPRYVRTILKGKCKFRLGVEQHVQLNEEKI